MKKIFLSFFILLIVNSLSFTFAKSSTKAFKGKIIYLDKNLMELKKGRTEVVLYRVDNTKYLKSGKKITRNDIEICQVVKALYKIKNKQRKLIKVEVLNESNCKNK